MCREGQKRIPHAVIYANPNFVGDQVSFELKMNRGENDMELRRKLTCQEYKSYRDIQNLIPATAKVGAGIVAGTSADGVVDAANIPGSQAFPIDVSTFGSPLTMAGLALKPQNPVGAWSHSNRNKSDEKWQARTRRP